MPLVEDVGTTKRGRMTPSRALRLWEAHKGICVLCGTRIDGGKDRWFIEHVRALELGGSDDDSNLGPAHYACKAGKDAADHSSAAKAKRAKRASLGIKASKATMPGSRSSRWKRKMDGTVVDRITGKPR